MTDDTFHFPAGFSLGVHAGHIKYPNRKDVGLILSHTPASCAAVFTKNTFAAAPVHYSRKVLQQSAGFISGVVVNAGCANAATGDQGEINAAAMGRIAAEATSAAAPFLVCSTGTIGVQLPMEKINSAVPAAAAALSYNPVAFHDFAESIMTTDTVPKVVSTEFHIGGRPVRIAGCAKGSGMIHPNMATMLAFVITDVGFESHALQQLFTHAVDRTLNCVTVDGDTSTNDTAVILANGASSVTLRPDSPALHHFEAALTYVLRELSKKLARDGEGATHLIEITVDGAETFHDARKAALSVANSPLVKTAIYGRDANWGRIACALGYSGIAFDPDKTDITLGDLPLMRAGTPVDFDEDHALQILSQDHITIHADLKNGHESATVYTCDLTEKYIEINGSYRT